MYTYLVTFCHFRSLSIRENVFINIFWFGSDNQSTKIAKVSSRCLKYFPAELMEVHQRGGCILGSANLCKISRPISMEKPTFLNLGEMSCQLGNKVTQASIQFVRLLSLIFHCLSVTALLQATGDWTMNIDHGISYHVHTNLVTGHLYLFLLTQPVWLLCQLRSSSQQP